MTASGQTRSGRAACGVNVTPLPDLLRSVVLAPRWQQSWWVSISFRLNEQLIDPRLCFRLCSHLW